MTRRERMERRAERLREWATNREIKAAQVFKAGEPFTSDIAFNTQPGHIPFRAKLIAREDRAFQSIEKAGEMKNRASNIEAALDGTIFSDDDGATTALRARIEEREAERARIVAYNASCRKALKAGEKMGDLSILDEEQKNELLTIARVCPYQMRDGGAFPAYKLSNLSGRIKADRDRLASIEKQNARRDAANANGGVTVERGQSGLYCSVTFAEKPEREILDALKAAGFRWSGGSWYGDTANLPQGIENS